MYDSIKLYLGNVGKIDESALVEYNQFVNQDTGELSSKGRLANLKIFTHNDRLIIDGSLSKYHYGSNLACLTRGETQKALESLGNALQIDIESAKVNRLDIAVNLILDEPPSNYYPYFGSLARYKRIITESNAVEYRTKRKSMILYDKIKECKQNKEPIPTLFQGRNVLRIEHRYKNRCYRITGSTLYAKSLYDEDFYMRISKEFHSVFQRIERIPMSKISSAAIESLNGRNIVDFMAKEYINSHGIESALSLIERAKNNDSIDRQRAWKLKAKIKEIAKLPDFIEPNQLTNEIDSKFDVAVSNFR